MCRRRGHGVVDDLADLAHETIAAEAFGVLPDALGVPGRRAPRAAGPRRAPLRPAPTSTPVSPSITVSSAPPRPSATTGRPHACASSGTMPKSSSPGRIVAIDERYRSRISSLVRQPRNRTSSPASASSRVALRAVADDGQRQLAPAAPRRSPGRPAYRARAPKPPGNPFARACWRATSRRSMRCVERRLDRGIHDGRLAIIVQRDPPRNILRDSEIAVYAALGRAVPAGHRRHDRPHHPAASPARPARARSRRRTGPRHSASASGSSTGAGCDPATTTDLAAQWLVLSTRS